MNKELEEAIKILNDKKDALNRHIKNYHEQDCETLLCKYLIEEKQAIETVLKYIDNSISKEVIEEKLDKVNKEYNKTVNNVYENTVDALVFFQRIQGKREVLQELLNKK